MADELRQYPPTARRLQRLRQAGLSPASEAVSATAMLLAASATGALVGPWAVARLGRLLATSLQRASQAPDAGELQSLLTRGLSLAAVVMLAFAFVVAGVTMLAQALQGNFRQRSSKRMYLPMKDNTHTMTRGGDSPHPLPALVAMCSAGALMSMWIGSLAHAQRWPGVEQLPQLGRLWLAWLGVLVVAAVVHGVITWRGFMRQARMTRNELLDELRETEGPRRTIVRRSSDRDDRPAGT